MQEEIELNGVVYVRKQQPCGDIKIMILQRGFVFVGRVEHDGDNVIISNSQNIRRWGTTAGLGQLAMSGPTADTKMDPSGTVSCHKLGVVAEIDCTFSGWSAICK